MVRTDSAIACIEGWYDYLGLKEKGSLWYVSESCLVEIFSDYLCSSE